MISSPNLHTSPGVRMNTEEIVLLDASGRAIGTAPKIASHHRDTPYHLAFSSYLVDDSGLVLITQRAHHKAPFPSVWTNSCCGHPAPAETLTETVTTRSGTQPALPFHTYPLGL